MENSGRYSKFTVTWFSNATFANSMMEYWNVGMQALVEWDLFLIRMARISL